MADSFQQIVGRYAIFDEIAAGGMATVHIGRLVGPVGFSRTVAIKRLHPQFAKDPEFVSMFVDEARLAARIRHPNVVPTIDVVKTEEELFLVMDYIQGESLSRLLRQTRRAGSAMAPRLVVPILAGVMHGLHAAHNATGERGEELRIVHRDVSPQNVLVGTDGVARVFDFGIAKARGRLQTTREGQIKGKLAYMAPEQLTGSAVGPQTDIYAAAVVLWESLAGRRCFEADNEGLLLAQVLGGVREPPSAFEPGVPAELDAIVMKGLAANPDARFATAREMALALERSIPLATSTEIGEWVEAMATEMLQRRADRIAEIESQSEIKAISDLISPSTPGSMVRARERTPSVHDDSQLSTISVSRSQEGERAPAWRRMALLGLGAVMIGGAASYLTAGWFGGGEPAASSAARPAGSADPIEPAVVPSATPSASVDPLDTMPSTTSDAVASAPRIASPAKTVRPTRPNVKPPPDPKDAPPKPNCSPPFYVDSEGIQRPKPECL